MYEERIISARDYQAQAVADTLAAFAAGEKGVMIRLPTGTGKTITAGLIVKDWLSRSPSHRVMVLCHEIQLIDQFAKELWDVTGHAAAIEQGSRRCAFKDRRKLVVASRSTLAERAVESASGEIRRTTRLAKFDYRDHWLVVSDEAHKYSLGLKTCGHVFQWFEQNPESRRLGITATPWRMDGVSLGTLFPHVAVDYRLMTWDGTPNAVDDGWCVPYEQKYIVVEGVDFKQLNVGRGDWTDENVARLLAETRMLSKYVDPTLDLVGKRPTLIFCPTVDMAKMVSDYINARLKRDCSRQLDGSVSHDDRRLVYQQFEGGVFQFLVVCGLCREGYDNPSIGAVAIFRPTKSTSLLEQMCGRGCRPLRGVLDGKLTAAERKAAIAASAKPTCLIVNLTGSTGLAGAATTAKCYLEGQPDEVVARTEARMVKGETNIARAVEQVKQEIADEEEKARKRQEKLAKDRERRRLRAEQQAALDAQVQYSAHNISPYSGTAVQAANHGGALLATEKQLKVLWRAGISVDASRLSRRHASALVGMVINHKPREVIRKLARKFQDATPAPDIHVTVTRVQERQPPEAHSAPVEVSEAPRHDTGSAVQDRVQASQEPDWGQVFPLFRQR